MVNNINRGSEWRKWDLHVHSPLTWLHNNYPHDDTGNVSDTEIEQFIQRVVDSGLSVVGLTNYYKFDDKDFEIKDKLTKKGIQTFLNLEVRLANVNKADEMIDYHIIFNPKLDKKNIINLLGSLKAKLGETNKSFNQLSNDEIEDKAAIDLDVLLNKLDEIGSGLSGNYITGFLSRGHGSATSGSEKKTQTIYEDIAKKTKILLHSSDEHQNAENDRDYWLDRSKYVRPLLQSSDAHSLEQIGSKYSWIKADTTFEGLRQILFEPGDRVSLSENQPEIKNDYQVIDHVELKTGKKIFFNPNLNTIIGGRSTGKSTLINSIAKKFVENKIIDTMYTFDDVDSIKIIWQDGNENAKGEIEFLPQNYMIEIAEDHSEPRRNKRDQLIESVVKQEQSEYEKIQQYNQEIIDNRKSISGALESYFETKQSIINLEKPEGDAISIKAQLEKLKREAKDKRAKTNFSENDSKEYDTALLSIQTYKNSENLIKKNIKDLDSFRITAIQVNKDLLNFNDSILQELKTFKEELEQDLQRKWSKKINDLIAREHKNQQEIQTIISGIEHSDIYKKGQENIAQNESLKQITESIQAENAKLEQFLVYNEEKKSLDDKLKQIKTSIIEKYAQYKTYREQLENNFQVKANDVEVRLRFKKKEFLGDLLNRGANKNNNFINAFNENSDEKIQVVFDKLDLTYNQKKSQNDLIKELVTDIWYDYEYILTYQNDEFDKMSQGKKAFVILSLILEFSQDKKPVIIDQPEDSLDNRAIYQELTKYLKHKKKERQIIVITHNPNIVVGADAENIIIANQCSTGTPNENETKFDYLNGALENINPLDEKSNFMLPKQSIRQHVFEILEGGKEAFEKREDKYNLKNGDVK